MKQDRSAPRGVGEIAADPKKTQLRGRRIVLRPLGEEHIGERYLRWMNDPAVNKYLELRFARHDIRSLSQFVERIQASADEYAFGIHSLDTAEHIGNIKLGPIDRNHMTASIGFLIGEISAQGKGVATEAVELMTNFAFGDLGLKKLSAGTYVINQASRRVFKKVGWAEEGLRRGHHTYQGKRVDVIEFGVLADEWNRNK